jgi:DNA-directed RNA polymerase specialized sigma subunit
MPNHFYMSLLANVLLGDRDAVRMLVEHLAPTIRQVVHRLAPPGTDMKEDLIQGVCAAPNA